MLAEPDYEAAERVVHNYLAQGSSFNPDGNTMIPEAKAYCCGSDGRTKIRANNTWPHRTVIVMAEPIDPANPNWNATTGGCTMQLIGASTALSAAHCFHDGNNWYPLAMWGAGPDDEDSQTFPTGHPGAYGCYWVSIPGQYISSNGSLAFDYAVIDFRNTCQPTPGAIVGWLGWGTYLKDPLI
jgi:hypothetical protein